MSATTCYFAWGCFPYFSWDVHCEERALAGVSKDGHKPDRALRPSFETPATPVIGPRYAPTRWRAPQDKVHRYDWFHGSDRLVGILRFTVAERPVLARDFYEPDKDVFAAMTQPLMKAVRDCLIKLALLLNRSSRKQEHLDENAVLRPLKVEIVLVGNMVLRRMLAHNLKTVIYRRFQHIHH